MGANNDALCTKWKYSIYENKGLTDGWTQRVNGQFATYFDHDGNQISDWTSYEGYNSSKCAEADSSSDGWKLVFYVIIAIIGTGLVGMVVYGIYNKCIGQWDSDSEEKDGYKDIEN